MAEKTSQQSVRVIGQGESVLPIKKSGSWFDKVRTMRKHPTIAMARNLAIAPALTSKWYFEATDDAPKDALEEIEKNLAPMRLHILQTGMLGCIDFGWAGYEKVFEIGDNKKTYLKKLKPLLHDHTRIMIDYKTGGFIGFVNGDENEVELNVTQSLLFNIDVEGTDWYGSAVLENTEKSYDEWDEVNNAATRYDKKIAGAMWVVHYPLGTSMFDGVVTPNDQVADTLLNALESSGKIKVPRQVQALNDDLNEQAPDAWKLELLTDSGSSKTAFIDRMMYLDKLMARSFSIPERAILEGQFGTKAESETQADYAISHIEVRHQRFLESLNWHCVNQLLRLNYGKEAENTVKVVAAPLSDPIKQYLKTILTTIMGSQDGFLEVVENLDIQAMIEKLGVPLLETKEKK